MEGSVVECDVVPGCLRCGCGGGGLGVLKEVQRAYERQLSVVDQVGGKNKMQMQVSVLRSWVSDLVGQNALLVRAVEGLETAATTRLSTERARHAEKDKNSLCNCKDLMTLNDELRKDNLSKEREIRRLMTDAHQYEQTIVNLRSEISMTKYHTPNSSKRDTEVMAGVCCTGNESGGAEAAGCGAVVREEAKHQERIQQMENNLKCAGRSVRVMRRANAALSEELHALRHVCAALNEQCRAAAARAHLKDDIILEMRKQLKQAKAKMKVSEGHSLESRKDFMDGDHKLSPRASCESVSVSCVRQQPRRKRTVPALLAPAHCDTPLHPDSDDCHTPRFDGSGDDAFSH